MEYIKEVKSFSLILIRNALEKALVLIWNAFANEPDKEPKELCRTLDISKVNLCMTVVSKGCKDCCIDGV